MTSAKIITLFFIYVYCTQNQIFAAYPGGNETTIEQRPYTASLQFHLDGKIHHFCSASIISPKYLLSAARCHPRGNIRDAYVRIGSTYYNSSGQLLKIGAFFVHYKYEAHEYDYDFGIALLTTEIEFGPNVAIVNLPETTVDPADESVLINTGWEKIWDQSPPPPEMKEANLPVYNREKCAEMNFITDRQMCLGGDRDGNCIGYVGGPAVQDGVQYGIASAVNSEGCSGSGNTGIYSKVSSVREWIRDIARV